jgi:thioredoxin reductase
MSYDVIVIGGSFAGLSAALQLARARRRVLVLDSGEPRNRFAQSSHGLFGHDGQSPSTLLAEARSQLLSYGTVSFTKGLATHAARAGKEFAVTVASGTMHTASRLILATGVRDDLAPIPGLQERWGVSVLHCFYCHGYEVAGRRLAVLATSDRALQTAILLPDWSEYVTLFTNDALSLSPEQLAELRTRGVSVEARPVVALIGDLPGLSGLRLDDGRIIPVDAIFTNPRTRMASSLAEQLGCEFDEGPSGAFIRTGADKQTTVSGVYAAGDAARSGHNASWAAADGVTAGIFAHQSLTLRQPACRS